MGVSLVRRLGSRISYDSVCLDRSGLCETSTGAFVAGMVPVAQRPVAGLRMGIQRRESAGPSLGRISRFQDRQENFGKSGLRIPGIGVSQAADEFHLVGESKGLAGQQYF